MYLLESPWSRSEKILIVFLTTVLPWTIMLTLIQVLSSNDVSLEMAIAGSGFLALFFTALVSLGIFLAGLTVSIGNKAFLIRKITLASLFSGLLGAFLVSLFPLNLLLVVSAQGIFVWKKLPVWRQDFPEDTVRLEPIFFITVGIKIVILATLVFASLEF